MAKQGLITMLSLLFLCFFIAQVGFAGAGGNSGRLLAGGKSPFTPKASLMRYWNSKIGNNQPKPDFLISKASPLTAVDAASFAKLADENALDKHLAAFCAAADLLCFPDLGASLKHDGDSKFTNYQNKNFTNYGSGGLGGLNSFKNYSDEENVLVDSFRRYSRDSVGTGDKFDSYGTDGNVGDQRFNTYGTAGTGGAGEFTNYNNKINNPNLRFTSYSTDGNGRHQTFKTYTETANSGDESFASYGRSGNSAGNDFAAYGRSGNVIGSTFSGYGKAGNAAKDSFKVYGDDGNVPLNTFQSYGEGGNAAVDKFSSYRDQANVGDDSFQSYAKGSNFAAVDFTNYGKSMNEGSDKFSGYGKAAESEKIGFKAYAGTNTTFKDYAHKKTVSFQQYAKKNQSSAAEVSAMAVSGKTVNKWVEPGKFFRESCLKKGTVMPMPDIKDKMPKRSFLPRTISSKLPFSTARLPEMKRIFHAGENSTVESMFLEALGDCERDPSPGENKRCVASVEDMIDFATTVLGRDVVVRSTENVNGAKRDVMIGTVRGINGGEVTKSVSCHQSLYPYMLYYCHSVPKVRVYEADILDPKSNAKINHGVALCHVDTSSWSATHGAFLALGSGPGKIEVCHWIFEGDMTWAKAD